MLKEFLLIVVIAAACQGNSISGFAARNGESNKYYLYQSGNIREYVTLDPRDTSTFPTSFFETTVIVVHGHEGTAFTSLNPTIRHAYLDKDSGDVEKEDINLIVVDWSEYSLMRYNQAVVAVPSVGLAIANFIEVLVAFSPDVTLDHIHLVGFDLGAHVVGFTGRALRGEVARITGLDPNSSQWGSGSNRLRESDAKYVEVIHTDGGGIFGSNGLGTAIGDADFFVNGGSNQPGCLTHSCSHERAWDMFAATIEYDNLDGNGCDNKSQITLNRCSNRRAFMGNNKMDKAAEGMYRVNTGRRYPY